MLPGSTAIESCSQLPRRCHQKNRHKPPHRRDILGSAEKKQVPSLDTAGGVWQTSGHEVLQKFGGIRQCFFCIGIASPREPGMNSSRRWGQDGFGKNKQVRGLSGSSSGQKRWKLSGYFFLLSKESHVVMFLSCYWRRSGAVCRGALSSTGWNGIWAPSLVARSFPFCLPKDMSWFSQPVAIHYISHPSSVHFDRSVIAMLDLSYTPSSLQAQEVLFQAKSILRKINTIHCGDSWLLIFPSFHLS